MAVNGVGNQKEEEISSATDDHCEQNRDEKKSKLKIYNLEDTSFTANLPSGWSADTENGMWQYETRSEPQGRKHGKINTKALQDWMTKLTATPSHTSSHDYTRLDKKILEVSKKTLLYFLLIRSRNIWYKIKA